MKLIVAEHDVTCSYIEDRIACLGRRESAWADMAGMKRQAAALDALDLAGLEGLEIDLAGFGGSGLDLEDAALAGLDDAPQPRAALGIVGEMTVPAPRLRRRLGLSFVVCRAWRADCRKAAIAAMKAQKQTPAAAFVEAVALEVASVATSIFGVGAFAAVASVACGHSRTPECMGKQIAAATAVAMGLPYRKLFDDRFVPGSSHPKGFQDLPPLTWLSEPAGPTLLIDDVATSGWHLKEAIDLIRGRGVAASALAWIGGDLRADG